ncbi:chemotaxis response regulator protein-glutamate methylesterase [Chitiniphilus purpureus]|uniref:Protein-glutamate methylesterase/protein-glutamine glutaminase n=1 Tax=Chitiniphilus purpureus TaxID=2981137 RepID=A0ABY6DWV8_9NEIS|nr:chemotaxis response regulator protein-glutamate methylesterase [Chitiniphilus sp. CD1]UXY16333.1 chemotaxis response regulator protein-glutamate methylesterase [Chitiniphilus sp. CD1]
MIKVMIVDDSSVVRQVMQEVLARHHDIDVIATASDPIFAMQKMKNNWPDVIVLDIEMPRMDGITFLKQLMATRPTPVVICSTLTQQGADVSMEALAAGAIGVISKPSIGLKDFLQDSSADLVSAIRAAAQARMTRLRPTTAAAGGTASSATAGGGTGGGLGAHERMGAPKLSADAVLEAPGDHRHLPTTEKIVALGTSTGGTQALEVVLTALPVTCPGLVVVQHMPEKFTQSFAARLNSLSKIEVREARHNDRIVQGTALIAPGGKHLVVKRSGARYYVEVVDGPLVCRHRPSVDVLFRSAAKAAGRNAIGIIMTGMGDDGARGLRELFDTGATTYAQDEASCVVFGMPKEAIQHGGVSEVVPLERIPALIGRHAR